MRKYYSLLAVAALMIAGCTNEKEFIPASDGGTVLTAIRDGSAVRTVIQEDGKTLWWNVGETIDVFYGGGSKAVVFTSQNEAPAATADFKGELDIPANNDVDIYAIYPSIKGSSVSADGEIIVGVMDTQPAVAGSFDDGIFPAVAVSKTTTLVFCNVAGGIKFSVGEDGVTEVEFKANGTEALAGIAHLKFVDGVPVIQEVESPVSCVSVTAPQGGFVKGENYYAAVLPAALKSGITITLKRGEQEPIAIVSNKAQTIKRGVIGNVGELIKPVCVTRVWGKYSTDAAAWNEYFGGTPGTDRNVAMDDDYIYIAETNKTKNLWALNVADGSLYKALPTTTVKEEGTFYLSCPRVINLDGVPTLVVCSMTEDIWTIPMYLYVYENGIEAEPTAVGMKAYGGGRMGDTFTFWGAGNATNSAEGQGLSKGMLYFDSMFQGDGIRIWKTQWAKGSLPQTVQEVQVRYAFDNGNTCVGAFWTYPESKDAGIWGARDLEAKSVYGGVKAGAPNLWNASGNQTDNTSTEAIESGWYKSVPCYQFFTYKDRRFVAYTRQVDGADGRLIILEGKKDAKWSDIITNHKVVYQAAIQEDAENQVDYNASPKASVHNAMDLCIRVKQDGVYLVCVKQNVGLSLFKLTLE